MPEGDTLHSIARVLGEALTGKKLTMLQVNGVSYGRRLAGRPVAQVWAKGKHLLIDIDGAFVLRTHLGMYGAWHRYRPGETWRRAASGARAVIETEDVVFVCFRPSQAELFPRARLDRHERLARLGPDLLADTFDWESIARRIPRSAAHTIAELLLDPPERLPAPPPKLPALSNDQNQSETPDDQHETDSRSVLRAQARDARADRERAELSRGRVRAPLPGAARLDRSA